MLSKPTQADDAHGRPGGGATARVAAPVPRSREDHPVTAGRGSRPRLGRGVLTDFDVRTLDDVVQATRLATPATWPEQLYARYLDPAPVKAVLHNAVEA